MGASRTLVLSVLAKLIFIHLTMASVLKAQEKNARKADAKGKRKADAMEVDEQPTQKRPRNKQRVLLLSSRGINHRMRHLMNDIEVLLPHVKKGVYISKT